MAIKINGATVIDDNKVGSLTSLSTTGNITGSYILGNGSQLTGIDATSIQSGTSNVKVLSPNGDVSVSVNGNSNVMVWASTGAYTSGEISATGNISGLNLILSGGLSAPGSGRFNGFVSVTGNIQGGNFLTDGYITATGNIQGGNINTNGEMSATGNIHAGNLISLGGIGVNGNAYHGGFISAGGNIISSQNIIADNNLYINSTINATGNATGALQVAGGGSFSKDLWVMGNVYAGNLVAVVANTITVQDPLLYMAANVTYPYNYDIGFYSQFSLTGPEPGNGYQHTGFFRQATSNIWYLFSNVVSEPTSVVSLNANTVYDTLQLGNLISINYVSAGGNVTGGNIRTAGEITATGNITGGNVSATNYTGTAFSASGNVDGNNVNSTTKITVGGLTLNGNTLMSTGSTLTIDPAGGGGVNGEVVIAGNLVVQGTTTTINSSAVITNDLVLELANNAATSTAATGAGLAVGPIGSEYAKWLYNSVQSNWTTALGISATGNITAGNLSVGTGTMTLNNIVNGGVSATGNIGSTALPFNTVFAKATSAQYADLAEMYEADAIIEPGTVVCFGGTKEITQCNNESSKRIAGVVSTNPSYIMNAGLAGENVVAVALTGRVPTKVTGSIRKGDMLISAGAGRARADADPAVGTVIGKALADFDGAEGVIEVVVGRL